MISLHMSCGISLPLFMHVVTTVVVSLLQPALEILREKCLDVLDSKEHVKALESLVTRYIPTGILTLQ